MEPQISNRKAFAVVGLVFAGFLVLALLAAFPPHGIGKVLGQYLIFQPIKPIGR